MLTMNAAAAMRMNTDLLPAEGVILCAVSGGADSMYLLCRLLERGYPVHAAHYNHGIRGEEADRDEAFVREFCRERGIPFSSERGDVPGCAAACGLSVEETARTMRYDFLERTAGRIGAAAIATAHNAGDNAETVLLNLMRGSGLRGLCGIPPVRGLVRRPMLDVTRQQVEDYLREHDIPYMEDSTNREDIYTRNRLRHEVMPVLRSLNPSLEETVGRTAALLRRDEECLSALAKEFIATHGQGNRVPLKPLEALPLSVRSRVVRAMAGRELSARQTEAILSLSRSGEVTDVSGLRVGRTREFLVFGAEDKPPVPERVLREGEWIGLPEAGLSLRLRGEWQTFPFVHSPFNTFSFPYEKICGSITVGSRREGERFRPAGRGCSKTLKQLFMENDIPAWERDRVPVLRDGEGILFVYGIGPAERMALRPEDKKIGTIEFTRLRPEVGGNNDA